MSNHHSTRSNHELSENSQRNLQTSISPTGIEDIRYFIQGFVLHQKSRRLSPHTINFYTDRLPRFIWFLEQQGYPTVLAEIKANHLRHFLIYLSEQKSGRWNSSQTQANRPLAQSTIHGFAKALRAFFRWASREADLPTNPFSNVEMPSLPNQWKVQTFTDEEIAALFGAIDKMADPFIKQRNRTILAILLDSGLRASELLSLADPDSIDLQDPMFSVLGKGKKTRIVVIGHFARKQVWAYLSQHRLKMKTEEKALFVSRSGRSLTYDGLRIMFAKLKELTGIDRVRVSAHIARHSFATKAHRNGMKSVILQEVLGHTKFETTRKYYLDVSPEDLKAEHMLFGPRDHMSELIRVDRSSPLLRSQIPRWVFWPKK